MFITKKADIALEQAHKDYERRKKATLANLKGMKIFIKQLHDNNVICDECYAGYIRIINNTANFIKEKEI